MDEHEQISKEKRELKRRLQNRQASRTHRKRARDIKESVIALREENEKLRQENEELRRKLRAHESSYTTAGELLLAIDAKF